MKLISITFFATALFIAACADPAANKPRATVTGAANSSAPAGSVSDLKSTGSALAISPENSKIEFTGSKVTGKHDGGFKSFRGVIDLVSEKPETSKVAVDIDLKSVWTDADGLTKHLQTADFFDVENFGTATFASTKIEPAGSAGNYNVTCDLTLRGAKKTVTFPAAINVTPNEVSVKSEFSINRKDFNIVYAGKADDLIRDDVVIRLDLRSPRK
jgi:polyisoprenoid-binding protein YceI